MGVIIDYCSLWQKGEERDENGEQKDERMEWQMEQFDEGLKVINTPYGHKACPRGNQHGAPFPWESTWVLQDDGTAVV